MPPTVGPHATATKIVVCIGVRLLEQRPRLRKLLTQVIQLSLLKGRVPTRGHPGGVNGLHQHFGAMVSETNQSASGIMDAVLWLRGCPGASPGVPALLHVVRRPCVS